MTFKYRLDGNTYDVLVVKKNNKNTYIKIKDDMTIYVTTNYLATKRYIMGILDNEREFLIKSLNKVKKSIEKEKEFYYLGKKYDIIVLPDSKAFIDGDKIYTRSASYLDKWLKSEMLRIFSERLKYNYDLFEEDIIYPILKIRSMKTRWGVCNKRDNSITLNSKLIKYSLKEIDYVIIHELSHLVYFDHSRDFWGVVYKYMPDYKKAVMKLKE